MSRQFRPLRATMTPRKRSLPAAPLVARSDALLAAPHARSDRAA